ncbi:hypothetical protein BGZ76_001887 [Entomortierella beljakovae]|nr:hypothetical protein BGZ76_001887 [Entomortierella beljakovae]
MSTAMFKSGMNGSLLNKDFFQVIVDRALGSDKYNTLSWSEQELDSSASILSNISSGDGDEDDDLSFDDDVSGSSKENEPCPMNDMTGHFLYKINFASLQQQKFMAIPNTNTSQKSEKPIEGELWVVIKSKPIDTALIELTNIMAQMHGGNFAEEYDLVKDLTGFRNSHIREIEIAELARLVGGAMERISTKVYNTLRNDNQQLYALCLEFLNPEEGNITHMNSVEDALNVWSPNDIHLVLRDLASFHAQFLGRESEILNMSFLENPSRSLIKVLRPAYQAMIEENRKNQPKIFSEFLTKSMLDYLENSDEHWALLEKSPRTLIHCDFNPRNICLRLDHSTGAQSLCAYDWELACCHVPQRDVVEFLSFVLPPGSSKWSHYIEYHRLALKASYEKIRLVDSIYPAVTIPSSHEYLKVAEIALMDFASQRVAMYGISNSFKQVPWLPRVISSVDEQLKRIGSIGRHQDRTIHHSKL